MTVASARGAAIGDSLARLLEFAGNEVEREYYINDYGTQVRLLRRVDPRPGARRGAARGRLPGRVRRRAGGRDRRRRRARRGGARASLGVEHMMERVRRTLERFRVHFDRFFSERVHVRRRRRSSACSSSSGEHVYEHEGALWLRTSTLGDDKDSVLIRSSGEPTYFASDIAYHEDKRERGYDRVDQHLGRRPPRPRQADAGVWSALGGERRRARAPDHAARQPDGGRAARADVEAPGRVRHARRPARRHRRRRRALLPAPALARHDDRPRPRRSRASSRTRTPSTTASTRTRGSRRSCEGAPRPSRTRRCPAALHPSEAALIKKLLEFPEEIEIAAERRAPHRITTYVLALAQAFSAFYRDCKVVGTPEEGFRLALALQTQRVIARCAGPARGRGARVDVARRLQVADRVHAVRCSATRSARSARSCRAGQPITIRITPPTAVMIE